MSRPKHAAQRPATFGDVFAVKEFRALYAASALSWVGDYLARAAIAALVFRTTHSVALSAGSFALGYLSWLTVGPLMSALAERYPKRTVMVGSDLIRAGLIAIVAIPGLPTADLFVLLFVASLLNPPFDSARAALLPSILTGDRYVVGGSLQTTTNNFATIIGYFVGGTAGSQFPHATLLFDAVTFLVSAAIVGFGVSHRPGATPNRQANLFRETTAGFRVVLGNPVLRSILIVVLGVSLLGVVPEGLAAAWAAHLTSHGQQRGLDQALIMMGVPVGMLLGAVIVGRFVGPESRRRLVRPLSVLVPVALAAALINPPVLGVAAISLVVGFCVNAVTLPSNGLFVQALPSAFRARAFGVVIFGLQLVQLAGILITGLFSDHFAIHAVVGIFGSVGIVVMVVVAATWPNSAAVDASIEAAKRANAEAEAAAVSPSEVSPSDVPAPATGAHVPVNGHPVGQGQPGQPIPNGQPVAPSQAGPADRPGAPTGPSEPPRPSVWPPSAVPPSPRHASEQTDQPGSTAQPGTADQAGTADQNGSANQSSADGFPESAGLAASEAPAASGRRLSPRPSGWPSPRPGGRGPSLGRAD